MVVGGDEQCISYLFVLTFGFSDLSRITMELVTDPNSPYRRMYPGSAVWIRKTTFWGGLFSTEYLSVQVVDGRGQPIFPAWSEFQQFAATTIVPSLKDDRLNDRLVC